MKNRILLLVCALLFSLFYLWSCSPQEPISLVGQWQATQLEEEGKALNVKLDKIRFSFDQNDIYQYESTLNYREAGYYEIKSKYLYTTDTLNKASTEKVVELVRLTEDTIVIRMEQSGKERLLTLAKEIN